MHSILHFTRSFDQTLAYPRHPAWTLQCVSLSGSVVCRRSGAGSFSVDAMGREGVNEMGREAANDREDSSETQHGHTNETEQGHNHETQRRHTSASKQGGVILVPSFSYEKGAPVLTLTAIHQFTGSLGFVPYPACSADRYKSLVSVRLDDSQTMHIRVSGDGCRLESAPPLSFTVD